MALQQNQSYNLPEDIDQSFGIPVKPEIKKLKINWAAENYNFQKGVNSFIANTIKSGDPICLKKRTVPNNGNPFTVVEILIEGTNRVIGQLARNTNFMGDHEIIRGFIVNEVIAWYYEDSVKFDSENPGYNFAQKWCDAAKNNGFIYLVDFAGYGQAD